MTMTLVLHILGAIGFFGLLAAVFNQGYNLGVRHTEKRWSEAVTRKTDSDLLRHP